VRRPATYSPHATGSPLAAHTAPGEPPRRGTMCPPRKPRGGSTLRESDARLFGSAQQRATTVCVDGRSWARPRSLLKERLTREARVEELFPTRSTSRRQVARSHRTGGRGPPTHSGRTTPALRAPRPPFAAALLLLRSRGFRRSHRGPALLGSRDDPRSSLRAKASLLGGLGSSRLRRRPAGGPCDLPPQVSHAGLDFRQFQLIAG